MGKKGCDASNMFDEEIPDSDREYSDDEVEKEAKRMKKLRKNGGLEDGEVPASALEAKLRKKQQKGGQPNKRSKNRHDFGDTDKIPVYSTNQSIMQQHQPQAAYPSYNQQQQTNMWPGQMPPFGMQPPPQQWQQPGFH